MLNRLLLLVAILFTPLSATAEVERLEILERTAFAEGRVFGAAGAYEKVRAVAHIALDPAAAANATIVDLKRAPRDGRGRVVFTSEVLLLRPIDPAKRNGAVVYDVNNRGGIAILGQINGRGVPSNDPTTVQDAGNGFLFEQGFTLAWSAWTWDARPAQPGARPFVLKPPVARGPRCAPITGKVAAEIIVDTASELADYTGLRGLPYPPAIADDPAAVMTERDSVRGERRKIPRARWAFVPPSSGPATQVRLQGGFQTGRIYEIVYTAKDPYVVGAGLAGIRDLLAHLKAAPVAGQPPLDRALIFGISQSGRVIQTMLRDGLHVDEAGRPAFDGAFIHVAGAGKGSFNHRFALPTRATNGLEEQGYPTDTFPFTTTTTRDPVTGESGSLLDAARRTGVLPKLFFVNTSAEYWNRAASLIHTTPDGAADAPVDPSARVYLLAGSQHYVGRSAERSPFLNCVNTTNHYPVMRALLLHLDRWTAGTAEPPPSAYPTLSDGTLTTVEAYAAALPRMPALLAPPSNHRPKRLDLGPRFVSEGIVDRVPAVMGADFESRAPSTDADGIDRSGVRLPELTVPLGTRTGWNRRDPATGFPDATGRFDGSFVPFARTEAERAASGDPRPSIEARYPGGRADFLARVRTAAMATVAAGFLRSEELEAEVAEEAALFDRLMAREPEDRSCRFLFAG